jgi:hypothetical protein
MQLSGGTMMREIMAVVLLMFRIRSIHPVERLLVLYTVRISYIKAHPRLSPYRPQHCATADVSAGGALHVTRRKIEAISIIIAQVAVIV